VWYQQAATQDTVLAAVGQVVGLEKEKNEAEGKRLDLEAKTEAAEAARRLLWSETCLL